MGIKDPLRDGIPEAVETCKEAGVKVRMVTGDILDTAVAISKDAKILPQFYKYEEGDYSVMTGKEFRTLVGGLIEDPEDTAEEGKRKKIVKNIDKFEEIT